MIVGRESTKKPKRPEKVSAGFIAPCSVGVRNRDLVLPVQTLIRCSIAYLLQQCGGKPNIDTGLSGGFRSSQRASRVLGRLGAKQKECERVGIGFAMSGWVWYDWVIWCTS